MGPLRPATWAVVAAFSVPGADASIYKHEIVDGQFREVSCTTLDDCLQKGFSTPGMLLHRTWAMEIEEALRRRTARLEELKNDTAIFARQTQARLAFQHRFLKAAMPQKAPEVRLLRRFEDPDRGVAVSLILFETWKGQAVPAVIFVPMGVEGSGQRLPAVLHLPGHLAGGLRDPEEQKLSLGLAQRGYVVLSFDPLSQGERQQYGADGSDLECRAQTTDKEGGPSSTSSKTPSCSEAGLPPCSKAHDHFGKQMWLLGRTAAELFVRDAQRALDVLEELPFVDPQRIGAVGCSGGGMLTAYLGAVDPRVQATAVACYFSTLGQELDTGTCNYDAEQILWGMAKHGYDKPDMLAARAPRPTAILLTSHDCFPLEGGRQGFAEAAPFWEAYGPPGASQLYASEAAGFHQAEGCCCCCCCCCCCLLFIY
ncbi:unnamed protein product [Polarella glacialis]|uniref:Acetyl xylan esterase domain-containing protein n=1 Tax=Polarella glacialis TaxID=89957 RepID=A0A813KHZ0_POLGL|nr:unnamed protein product [Polarella glacialis]